MIDKIVGFFATREQADRAKEQLLNAGFTRDEIGVYSGKEGTGLWGEIKGMFGFADEEEQELYHEAARRGSVAVWVDLANGDTTRQGQATQILQSSNPVDLDAQAKQWRAQGWTGRRQNAAASMAAASTTTSTPIAATTAPAAQKLEQGKSVMPVVQEELQVGKRQVQSGGLRIYSRVTEKPVQEQIKLREERVDVQRRPVDRPVTDADRAFQPRSIEVTATSEQAVVNKQARVVEEVVVNKDVTQRTETVRDKVRRTDVQVEKTDAYQGQDTAVADQFAEELSANASYRGRDWRSIESDARQSFERKYPGSKWDQVKDAVYRSYERRHQNA